MTTIKPLTGGINLEVRHIGGDGHALINVGPLPKPSRGGYVSEQSARYPVADILAALGAVSDKEHDDTLEALGEAAIQRQRIANDRDQWKARADKAEAKLAEAAAQRDDAIDARDSLWKERDALAATVERVREATAIWGDGQFRAAVLAALDPKPEFVLPTEAGAGIMATDSGPRCYEREYRLFTDGMWHGVDGSILHPKTLMANYIAHRLIEDVA